MTDKIFGLVLIGIVSLSMPVFAGAQDVPSDPPSQESEATVDRLLDLIETRLTIACDVAKAKWNSWGAIDVPEREARILDQVLDQAERGGVSRAFAQGFVQHQFDASKTIQRRLHETWSQQGQPPFESPPSLADDIRPRLDRLTPKIITALARFETMMTESCFSQTSDFDRKAKTFAENSELDPAAMDIALQPLREFSRDRSAASGCTNENQAEPASEV